MAWALAGLRVLVGVLWLSNLSWKLPPDFGRDDPRGLLYSFRLAEHHALVGPLRDMMSNVVIPHFTTFGWLVFLTELTAGLLLLLGWHTRLGALIGTGQAIAITALVSAAPGEWRWGYLMLIALSAVPLLGVSDLRLSLAARRR